MKGRSTPQEKDLRVAIERWRRRLGSRGRSPSGTGDPINVGRRIADCERRKRPIAEPGLLNADAGCGHSGRGTVDTVITDRGTRRLEWSKIGGFQISRSEKFDKYLVWSYGS
jgi:hypothetical protein